MKKKKLATRLCLIMAILLSILFAILITTTALNIGKNVSKIVSDEFDEMSVNSANQVQAILDTAKNSAISLTDYITYTYENQDKLSAEELAKTRLSDVFSVPLQPQNYDMEKFIIGNERSVVKNNEDIVGMGTFFEPKMFDPGITDYTVYMNEENVKEKKVHPYGAYRTYKDKEFYRVALDTKKPYVTAPYEQGGMLIVSYCQPIIVGDKAIGVVMADINVTNFSKIFKPNPAYPNMYLSVIDEGNILVFDSESSENITKDFTTFFTNKDELKKITDGWAKGVAFGVTTKQDNGTINNRFFNPVSAGAYTWWVQTVVSNKEMNTVVTQTIVVLVSLCLAALVIIILCTAYALIKDLKPLEKLVAAAQRIERGDLDVEVTITSQDEIGTMAHTFKTMADNIKLIIEDIDYLLGEMAKGNLRVHSKNESGYVGQYANILTAIRLINHNLSSTMSQINEASEQVASGSEQVSSGAQALSQGATEQASSIEELSATIQAVSNQIKDNANNAKMASELSSMAGKEVQNGNEHMQSMIVAMEDISSTSNKIGKIIKTIDDIAFQTNILALNAAVEAARAGSAGKGFAVVANEVRNLAGKSAEAAKNTTSLIESSINAVANGTKIADETAMSLKVVVEKSNLVLQKVEEIAEASAEQANSVVQITTGVDQISAVIQTNSATAEESAAASEELSSQSQMLKDLVGKFTLREVDAKETFSSYDEMQVGSCDDETPADFEQDGVEIDYSESENKY